MPWSGSGEYTFDVGDYTGVDVFDQAANAGEDVTSGRFTSLLTDLKVGIENLVTRDGQNAPSANLPMGGHKHTNVADADSDTEYAAWGQVEGRLIPDVMGVSANYTVVAGDVGKILRVNATTAAVAVALPDLGAGDEGYQIEVRKSDNSINSVTIEPDGSDTIDGEATFVLEEQYGSIQLLWAGAEWLTRGGAALPGDAIADLLETLTGTDRLSFNALRDVPASVGSFDLYADVTTEVVTIATDDRFVISDISIGGEPNRYIELANLKTAVQFDLRDDVTSETTSLAISDRFLVSDVSLSGSPNHYVTASTARSFFGAGYDIHDHSTTQLTTLNSLDRMAITDESVSGDPMRYLTLGQIRTFVADPFDLHDDVSDNLTTISTADRMLISDEGSSGDPQRYVNVSQLDARFGGNLGSDITAINTLTQAAYDALTPSSGTLYLIAG